MLNVLSSQGEISRDDWVLSSNEAPSEDANAIAVLAQCVSANTDIASLQAVVIDNTSNPEQLPEITHCKLIAIDFPGFVDGRGYSLARILREDLNYQGDLRAVGDIRNDQLADLQRCGFSSFALNADQDVEQAKLALKPLAKPYQADAVEIRPLFRRR